MQRKRARTPRVGARAQVDELLVLATQEGLRGDALRALFAADPREWPEHGGRLRSVGGPRVLGPGSFTPSGDDLADQFFEAIADGWRFYQCAGTDCQRWLAYARRGAPPKFCAACRATTDHPAARMKKYRREGRPKHDLRRIQEAVEQHAPDAWGEGWCMLPSARQELIEWRENATPGTVLRTICRHPATVKIMLSWDDARVAKILQRYKK